MTVLSVCALRAGAAVAVVGLALGGAGLAAAQSATSGPQAQSGTGTGVPTAKAVPGGGVVLKGKGYSIETVAPRGGAAAGETKVTDAPLESLHEPIICDGQRVLHIDNRDLRFDGNAITAKDGCEVHITNSRISAGGIAIRARNASVHIENSEILGGKASIDATGRAQVYAETSTFKGAARRLDQASIHDLGNNVWQ